MTDSLKAELERMLTLRADAAGVETAGVALIDESVGGDLTIWRGADTTSEPRFLTYSISKTVLATLVLLQHERGALALDQRLADWHPGVPGAERITLRQLLQHTAGLRDYGPLPAYHDAVRAEPSTPWSFRAFCAATLDHGLLFEPGTGWRYSNPGYMLLKDIVCRASGVDFSALVEADIAQPLGLLRTGAVTTTSDLADLAPAPSRLLSLDASPCDTRTHYHPGWVSHGVLASTPAEIARFMSALFGGQLLSKASLRAAEQLVPVPREQIGAGERPWVTPSYGLGLMGDPDSAFGLLLGHDGGGPGYRTSAFQARSLGGRTVTVCVMAATEDDTFVERLLMEVLRAASKR